MKIINDVVKVDLAEVIATDLEGFLDLLNELLSAGREHAILLLGQEYAVIGVTPEGELLIHVTGENVGPSDEDEDDEDEEDEKDGQLSLPFGQVFSQL